MLKPAAEAVSGSPISYALTFAVTGFALACLILIGALDRTLKPAPRTVSGLLIERVLMCAVTEPVLVRAFPIPRIALETNLGRVIRRAAGSTARTRLERSSFATRTPRAKWCQT
jgi:hypothetical protein